MFPVSIIACVVCVIGIWDFCLFEVQRKRPFLFCFGIDLGLEIVCDN